MLLLTSGSLSLQLAQCSNAMRTSPDTFADAINAVCSYSTFSSNITQPQRGALLVSAMLEGAAEEHTNDMASNNYFNHTSLNGTTPYDRIEPDFPGTNDLAEIIAAGYTSVLDVLVGVMWCVCCTERLTKKLICI